MPLLFHSGQLIRFAVGCKIVLLHGSSGIFKSNFNNMRVASMHVEKKSRVDHKFSIWWKKKIYKLSLFYFWWPALLTFHFVQLIDCCSTHSNVPRPKIVVSFSLPTFFYTYSSIVSRVGALLHSTLKFIVETGCWQMAPLRFSLPTLIGFWGAKLQLDSICLPKKKLRGKCLFSAPQALLRESRVGFL